MKERVQPRRAQVAGSLLHGEVEVRQRRRHHAHHIGDRQQRVADQQAGDDLQIVLIDDIAQHDEAQHNARDEHWREEERLDGLLAREAVAVERVGRGQTQQQRDGGRRQGDDQAQLRRVDEGAHRQHLLIPVQREALAGELERLRLAEGGRGDDQQRADQEEIDQYRDEHQRAVLLFHGDTLPSMCQPRAGESGFTERRRSRSTTRSSRPGSRP